MIDRQYNNEITFECDGCDLTCETGTGDFNLALQVIRQEGWRPTNIAGEWLHLCPECKD